MLYVQHAFKVVTPLVSVSSVRLSKVVAVDVSSAGESKVVELLCHAFLVRKLPSHIIFIAVANAVAWLVHVSFIEKFAVVVLWLNMLFVKDSKVSAVR